MYMYNDPFSKTLVLMQNQHYITLYAVARTMSKGRKMAMKVNLKVEYTVHESFASTHKQLVLDIRKLDIIAYISFQVQLSMQK